MELSDQACQETFFRDEALVESMEDSGDLQTILDALSLKDLRRTGWVRAGVPPGRQESVADHCWGMALLVQLLCPPELDRARCILMAVGHDLGEVSAGDITPHDKVDGVTKHRMERQGMLELVGNTGGQVADRMQQFLDLWDEFEASATPEAILVRQVDVLDRCIRAVVLARDHPELDGLDEFMPDLDRVTHPALAPLAVRLREMILKNSREMT